jgi:hypothetical protein
VDLLRENKATLVAALRPAETVSSVGDGLGLVAKWSRHFGYVSIYDPTLGEWWALQAKDAPGWAVSEAHRRKALWRAGNRRAYELAAAQMELLWKADHPPAPDEGIVETHPDDLE